MIREIACCRICGNRNLIEILDLGQQYLSGHFPRIGESVDRAPLTLVKCDEIEGNSCGLVQLKHTYDLSTMYGKNYGYRSGLNASMVSHLSGHVARIESTIELKTEDIVVDIGSNDGTLLSQYKNHSLTLVGVDPTIAKFSSYYPSRIIQLAEFFPSAGLKEILGTKKAKVITSVAMFYDLEAPQDFVNQISAHLDPQGIWLFEQSYLPTMLAQNSYDTVCHEHLEYYSLRQIDWMLSRADLKIIDVQFTDANGGSFLVVAAKNQSSLKATGKVAEILDNETRMGLATLAPYEEFTQRILKSRDDLRKKIQELNREGKRVIGYGASTKGNVLLQYCDLTAEEVPMVAEVNPDKFGCETPGSRIPIVNEKTLNLSSTDVLMPLPWHFRPFFERKLQPFLNAGGSILFPLPRVELVDGVETRRSSEVESRNADTLG